MRGSLSLASSPLYAVAHTAPALLLANAHRAFLYRESLDRKVAGAFILGTVPAALVGSLVADQVQARDSLILVAKAERIEGEGTRVMLTPRSAMLLGAALGLTLLLGRRLLGGRG